MKDTLVIGAAILVAIALGAWLIMSGGEGGKGTAATHEGTLQVSVLEEGDDSGPLTDRKNYRIKSKEELDSLLQTVGEENPSIAVDFSKHEVLAVFDGEHPTGGYEVAVASVEDTASARVVTIVHTEPGASCIMTEALTSPFVLVVVPKSDAPIERKDIVETRECS